MDYLTHLVNTAGSISLESKASELVDGKNDQVLSLCSDGSFVLSYPERVIQWKGTWFEQKGHLTLSFSEEKIGENVTIISVVINTHFQLTLDKFKLKSNHISHHRWAFDTFIAPKNVVLEDDLSNLRSVLVDSRIFFGPVVNCEKDNVF